MAFSAAGEVGEGRGDVGAGDLSVRTARAPRAASGAASSRRVGPVGQPVARAHVHADQVAARARGHAGGPADELLAAGRAGDRDDDPLAASPSVSRMPWLTL